MVWLAEKFLDIIGQQELYNVFNYMMKSGTHCRKTFWILHKITNHISMILCLSGTWHKTWNSYLWCSLCVQNSQIFIPCICKYLNMLPSSFPCPPCNMNSVSVYQIITRIKIAYVNLIFFDVFYEASVSQDFLYNFKLLNNLLWYTQKKWRIT